MEISVFAKKVTIGNGKSFYKYLSTLTTKDGEQQGVRVMFAEGCEAPKPADCPVNIVVDKGDCNVSKKKYTDKNGNSGVARTLWVSKYSSGSEYVDNSMDDYDF